MIISRVKLLRAMKRSRNEMCDCEGYDILGGGPEPMCDACEEYHNNYNLLDAVPLLNRYMVGADIFHGETKWTRNETTRRNQ